MTVQIEKLDHYGRGITRINDKICFVENALPKEIVEIKITKETKKYFLATTTKIIKKSKDRTDIPCPYTNQCGGCNLAHLSFEKENEFKTEKVKEIMNKFAKLDSKIIKEIVYDKPYHYRNKITLHQKEKKIGLYQKETNNIIPITKCFLLPDKLNKELSNIKPNNKKDIILKLGNKTNEILSPTTKKKHIISYIGNKKYQVSKKSFFQINNIITEKLYNEIKDIIKEKNSKKVLDLYCGTGTIGIYISDITEKVLGIESCKEAVIDAEKNKELNHAINCTYKLGKVEDLTTELTKEYDTAIIDPPRSGLHKKVVEKLLEITPKNLIYISCDPVTLARDLNLLKEKYEIEYIRPYNMFPRTYHVECCTVLSLKKEKKEEEVKNNMRKLTKRYIITSLENLNLSIPIRYERYYINDTLRTQKKGNTYEKEIINENNTIIKKENISESEFQSLKENAYSKIIRDSYLYLDDDRVSIKKYLVDYQGLYRVEVTFKTKEEENKYQKENWMGKEITNSPLAFDKDLSKLSKEEFKKELEKYRNT